MDPFDELYSHLLAMTKSEKITVANIVDITTRLMAVVEQIDGMTGLQRKEMVLNVLKQYIRSQIHDDDFENVIVTVVDYTLPHLIDTIISFDRGELRIALNKATSCCFGKKK
jgi:hypothetical protein